MSEKGSLKRKTRLFDHLANHFSILLDLAANYCSLEVGRLPVPKREGVWQEAVGWKQNGNWVGQAPSMSTGRKETGYFPSDPDYLVRN